MKGGKGLAKKEEKEKEGRKEMHVRDTEKGRQGREWR